MFKAIKKKDQALIVAGKKELDKIVLRYLMHATQGLRLEGDPEQYLVLREILQERYSQGPRSNSISRIMNISDFNGRTRGFYTEPKMSRIEFKSLANQGTIPGFRKSSW